MDRSVDICSFRDQRWCIVQTCSEYILILMGLHNCLYSYSWELICTRTRTHRFWKLCIGDNAKFCTRTHEKGHVLVLVLTTQTLPLYSYSWHCTRTTSLIFNAFYMKYVSMLFSCPTTFKSIQVLVHHMSNLLQNPLLILYSFSIFIEQCWWTSCKWPATVGRGRTNLNADQPKKKKMKTASKAQSGPL